MFYNILRRWFRADLTQKPGANENVRLTLGPGQNPPDGGGTQRRRLSAPTIGKSRTLGRCRNFKMRHFWEGIDREHRLVTPFAVDRAK